MCLSVRPASTLIRILDHELFTGKNPCSRVAAAILQGKGNPPVQVREIVAFTGIGTPLAALARLDVKYNFIGNVCGVAKNHAAEVLNHIATNAPGAIHQIMDFCTHFAV